MLPTSARYLPSTKIGFGNYGRHTGYPQRPRKRYKSAPPQATYPQSDLLRISIVPIRTTASGGELPFFSEWLYLGLCRKGIIPPFTPDEQALMRAQYAQEQRAKAPLRQRLKQTLSPEGDLSLKREIALKFFFQKCQQQGIEKIC